MVKKKESRSEREKIEEFARKPAWTVDHIMSMVFPESYETYKKKIDKWVSDYLSGKADLQGGDSAEDCKESKFEAMLQEHTKSGNIKSSKKEYNPDNFMEWWDQWKMETFVGYKPDLLYKVFSIRRSFKTINKAKERGGGFLPAPAVNTFRRDGDIWEFSFNETTYRFPHLKGFEYLFEIIKRQGEKINALDLDAIVSPQSAIPKVNENLYQDEEGNSESGLSFRKGLRSELPILSEKEIKDLKKDLEGEKDRQKNAIIEGNIEVENEATEAIRLIEEQLNAAPTSTRRSKHEDPAMENSRKGIKKNINTAIKKIKDGKAEDLAAHLKESISTGRDISYNFGKPTVPWETS